MAKIKVSEATVAKLRKGTMEGNLAKAKNASPELREALIRFYGAKRVNAAVGKATKPSSGPGGKILSKPRGGPGAKLTSKTSEKSAVKPDAKPVGTYRVRNPINPSNPFGNAQAKLDAKAAATKILLEKNKKAREEKSKKK